MLTMNGIQGCCIQECSTSLAVACVQRVKSQSISRMCSDVLALGGLARQSKIGIRPFALTKKHAADINDRD